MKLSIVSPTFNGAADLAGHLASIEAQTFRDFEHIIVDNMSTDVTEEMVRAYMKRALHEVHYIREPDSGIYAAMNKGIKKSRGEWLHFFNSDNVYARPTTLEEFFACDWREFDLVAHGVQIRRKSGDGEELVYQKPEYDEKLNAYGFPHQGVLIRKSIYDRHGLYSEKFRIVSDSIYASQHYPKARWKIVDTSIAVLKDGGISGTMSWRNTWENVVVLLVYHKYPFGSRISMAARALWHQLKFSLRSKQIKDAVLQAFAVLSRRITPPDHWLRAIYSPDHRGSDFFETVIPYDGDLKIHIHTGSFFEWEIFFKGYYEPYVVRILQQFIKCGNVCLDVGANIGSDTLIMAKLAGPAGRVYAFEPNPDYFARLQRNIELNRLNNVTSFMKAIDVSDGKADLFIATGSVKTASMVQFMPAYARRNVIETVTVGTALGDLAACHFIKIDVDGTEGRILESCKGIIQKHFPLVLFEYSDEAWAKAEWPFERTARLFKELNYSLYKVGLDGNLTPLGKVPSFTNILCIPGEQKGVPGRSERRHA